MKQVKIELKFDNDMTRLAGNPFGREIYNEQVKDRLDMNAYNIIIFPESIVGIASSFVQGFFSDIVNKIGLYEFNNKIQIIANEKVEKKIKLSL